MELSLLKKKLAQGSLAGLARVGLAVPLYLILTPFVLHKLGPELFGLWSFGTLVISVMTLTDFGLKNALIYHIAGEINNRERVNLYFNVTFLAYALMTLLVLLLVVFASDTITMHLLSIPAPLHAEAKFVLWVTAASFGLRFLAISLQALVEAHQAHATVQLVLLGWLLINFLGTLVALNVQADIYALGFVSLFSNAFVLLTFWFYVKRFYPFIRFRMRFINRRVARDMFGYGTGIQFATLLIAAREPLLKILIARSYDLISVASFEIIYKLCTQLVSLVTTPLLGSFAASAMLSKRSDDLQRVLRPMFAFSLAAFVPAVLFMASFSQPLVSLWLGEKYAHIGMVLPVVFTAFSIYYSTEILYKTIEASGMSGYSAIVQFISLGLTISVFFMLINDANISIPASLLAGFITFSLLNMLVFRWRFPTIRLIYFRQWVWLLSPAVIFISLQSALPSVIEPGLFFLYIGAHLWCVRHTGLFDTLGIARKLIAAISCKI